MFTITVRDHVMIAHSLRGEEFGPAQRLHGATFVVEATLARADVNEAGVVADLGAAAALLRGVLAPLDYRNLDDEPAFAGRNSTTEVVARHVADALAERIAAGALSADGEALASIAVVLREHPDAAAGYERAL